jgi:hypothetical protein
MQVLRLSFPNQIERQSSSREGGSPWTHAAWSLDMDDWFSVIAAGSELPPRAIRELEDVGFVVIPGPDATADWIGGLAKYMLNIEPPLAIPDSWL